MRESTLDIRDRMTLAEPPAQTGPANTINVACPQCGAILDIPADDTVSVRMRPKMAGDGWRSYEITATASGSAVHTHSLG